MTDNIVSWFYSLPSDTQIFVTIVSATGLIFHLKFNRKTALYAPTILTTGGIFCTFLGIAIGLMHFDATNIRDSVPQLLNGLKTAFWASVFGVGGALSLKGRDYIFGAQSDPNSASEATINDLNKSLSLLLSALASPDGESLVSQVKLMRQDMNDKLEKLRISQEKSLEALAEMGSKALIEALEGVIRDFNDKLTTQFGENFSKLNEAVHKIVEWQENYKSHVEVTEKAIVNASEALQIAMTTTTTLIEKAHQFSTTSDKLSTVIGEIEKQMSIIAENMNLLQSVLNDTSKAIPAMKLQTEEFVSNLTKSIRETSIMMTDTSQVAVKDIQTANSEMTKATTELANQIRAQSTALEKEIEKALTVSITTLGQQLGTLSEKFVSDYQPLTQSLRQLLASIDRGLNN